MVSRTQPGVDEFAENYCSSRCSDRHGQCDGDEFWLRERKDHGGTVNYGSGCHHDFAGDCRPSGVDLSEQDPGPGACHDGRDADDRE